MTEDLVCNKEEYTLIHSLEELNNLSESIKSININFNDRPIANWPDHIERIVISNYYNNWKISVNNLPPNLRLIYFSHSFDQSIDNLPSSVTDMEIGMDFNRPINKWPPNLQYLSLQNNDYNPYMCDLPDSLVELDIGGIWKFPERFNKLSPNIRTIHCTCEMYKYFSKDIEKFVPNVTTLVLDSYPHEPFALPPKLEKIMICEEESCVTELIYYFSEYIISYDTGNRYLGPEFSDKTIHEPGVCFNNQTIVFENQINDTIMKLHFIDKDSTEFIKDRSDTTYEECVSFLLKGYNIKSSKKN